MAVTSAEKIANVKAKMQTGDLKAHVGQLVKCDKKSADVSKALHAARINTGPNAPLSCYVLFSYCVCFQTAAPDIPGVPCAAPCDDKEQQRRRSRMAWCLTEYRAASALRIWMIEFMSSAHASDLVIIQQVQASLRSELAMAAIVEETRKDQEDGGAALRECSLSAQLKHVQTSAPQLQEFLDRASVAINDCTRAQAALVTTQINMAERKLTKKFTARRAVEKGEKKTIAPPLLRS
jgi:hypothetical protein